MAYSIDVFNKDGKKVSTLSVNETIFNDERINETAIAEFVRLQMANERIAIASTKTRGQIRWSWRKLYRQKGTGSARVGDKKSPLRKKGWVVFGPSSARNFSITLPKKVRRSALAWLVTKKLQVWAIMGLDSFSFEDIKTKNAISVLEKLSLNNEKVLVVTDNKDDVVLFKSFNNLPRTKVLLAEYLNPRDLLNHTKVLLIADSLKIIEKNVTI